MSNGITGITVYQPYTPKKKTDKIKNKKSHFKKKENIDYAYKK